MTASLLEALAEYERAGETFTLSEVKVIGEFVSSIQNSGLRDCVESITVEHVSWHESMHQTDLTRIMLREHAKMLECWYLALDQLLGEVLTCNSEVTRYSPAAARYVEAATRDYHRARQGFEYVTTVWALALNYSPASAYPPPTHSVDLLTQSLVTD